MSIKSGDIEAMNKQLKHIKKKNAEQKAQLMQLRREKLQLEAQVQTQQSTMEMFQMEYHRQKQQDINQI